MATLKWENDERIVSIIANDYPLAVWSWSAHDGCELDFYNGDFKFVLKTASGRHVYDLNQAEVIHDAIGRSLEIIREMRNDSSARRKG